MEHLQQAEEERHKQEMQFLCQQSTVSSDCLGMGKLSHPSAPVVHDEVVFEPMADLISKFEQHHALVISKLEDLDAKVEMSVSGHMQRAKGSFWSLPLPCQTVTLPRQTVIPHHSSDHPTPEASRQT